MRKIFLFVFSLMVFTMAVAPSDVLAVAECGEGYELLPGAGVCIPTETGLPDPDPVDPVWVVLDTLLRWLLGIFGFIAIGAFVVSGLMYLTAAGNETQIDTAKRYMVWSIVGVAVALLGFIVIVAVDTWLRGYAGF